MKQRYLFLLIPLLSAVNFPALAQTISEVDALHFGSFAVVKNDAPYSITVTPDNDTLPDAEIVVDEPGQRAEYFFEGLPNNVNFYIGVTVPNPPTEGGITVDAVSPTATGPGPNFTISNFLIDNAGVMQSNGSGEARVYIGATLTTSGTNAMYGTGNYNGTYEITIYY